VARVIAPGKNLANQKKTATPTNRNTDQIEQPANRSGRPLARLDRRKRVNRQQHAETVFLYVALIPCRPFQKYADPFETMQRRITEQVTPTDQLTLFLIKKFFARSARSTD